MSDFILRPFETADRAPILDLSLRAWAPVFDQMQRAVPDYVYRAFYPAGWQARQTADILAILDSMPDQVWVAVRDTDVQGWVGLRTHPEDRMGEIHIIAVDPNHQKQGVARALMNHAFGLFAAAGLDMVMVETGGDPGHAPSRATYESAGFDRWPVARYFRKL